MTDHATANLPSRDFDRTAEFYARIGFATNYRDDNWMILRRGTITLEFFPHPELDPAQSWFSACLRLDDVDSFLKECADAGIEEKATGFPRIHAAAETGPVYMGALLDIDGSLLRVIAT